MDFVLKRYVKESLKRMRAETEHLLNLLDQHEVQEHHVRSLIRRALIVHEKLAKEIERL